MSSKTMWQRRVSPAMAVGVVGVLVVAGVAAGLCLLQRPVSDTHYTLRPLLPDGSYPPAPIPAGDLAPTIDAEGWVNDPLPTSDTERKLVVLDVWSSW